MVARRKFALIKNLLNYMGVEENRVNFTWVSASEGARFAELITDLTGKVKEMGPNTGLFRKAE
ncbi:heterodisulfide reductase subunit [Desulforamulus ferrireducens]|uniref:Heterodisulfide reductase subunit n=1 Tax=Desulforamulus ferrireducens TaxID=1833852 RepID=A0A1S6IT03_9FIRM|nr:heterodisulfide reductase subunit [Desulforamulus ferrireducens]AQS57900.1 heterodisulfide reductase subunit [Desulforamulus ferrireducens]